MFGSKTVSPQLAQAVADYGAQASGAWPILRQRTVKHNVVEVENAHAVVRIAQAADGLISLAGFSKTEHAQDKYDNKHRYTQTYRVLCGVWFVSAMYGGWRIGGQTLATHHISEGIFPKP
jgi:hypothetical protein